MNIEPIHTLPSDELENLLSVMQDGIEELKVHIKPQQPNALNLLTDSVKKSLVFFFPEHAELIAEITDANEAIYAMSWAKGYYPLAEGVEALRKIYGVIFNYETLKAVHEWEAAAEEMEQVVKEMKNAIFKYAESARYYFHTAKMKKVKPEIDRALKVKAGQEKSHTKGKAKGVLLAIKQLRKNIPSMQISAFQYGTTWRSLYKKGAPWTAKLEGVTYKITFKDKNTLEQTTTKNKKSTTEQIAKTTFVNNYFTK